MGGWGRQNPWPFQWGGGQSDFERLWMGLRAMLGPKGPGPIGGLEDAWRESETAGIIAVAAMAERAMLQGIPSKATDHLPVYEQLLGLFEEDTEEARRLACAVAWTTVLSCINPDLAAQLTRIDTGISIVLLDPNTTATSQFGKMYEWLLGAIVGSQWPNYSNDHILYLQWSGCPAGIPPQDKLAQVERLLNQVLPGWVDYVITNDTPLFYLDGFMDSRLDLTPFGA
jgi:hypothetical protein